MSTKIHVHKNVLSHWNHLLNIRRVKSGRGTQKIFKIHNFEISASWELISFHVSIWYLEQPVKKLEQNPINKLGSLNSME